jgi:hypothetical protein
MVCVYVHICPNFKVETKRSHVMPNQDKARVQGKDSPLPAHLPGPSCKYNGLAALYTTFYSQLWFYVQNLSQIG